MTFPGHSCNGAMETLTLSSWKSSARMTTSVARAVTTAIPTVAPARKAMSFRLVVAASSAAANANGAMPAIQRRPSDAALTPANSPAATAGTQDVVRESRTRTPASTTAPNGFVPCAPVVERKERSTNGPTTSATAPAVTPAHRPATDHVTHPSRTAPMSVSA
jgi:hypothetical protein